ncbi:hypothetical protein GCM10011516_15040 [Sphingobacterium cellulitidis]|uniref:Uncharacterized protein n=2 Tax=Sphingobacterium cellulitidis TaxID=1768011 RepID=A0A8H9KVI3_9SPHI|nr:hypothetical protein GCM10011516_15040 [Sphingobacterium soli]
MLDQMLKNMLKDISWMEYIKVVSAMIILYYLTVVVILYRTRMLSLFKTRYELEGGDEALTETQKESPDTKPSDLRAEREFEDSIPQGEPIERFAKDLRVLLESKTSAEHGSKQLVEEIRSVLSRFPSLHDLGLRDTLNEFILSECERCQVIIPNVDELDALWKGAV